MKCYYLLSPDKFNKIPEKGLSWHFQNMPVQKSFQIDNHQTVTFHFTYASHQKNNLMKRITTIIALIVLFAFGNSSIKAQPKTEKGYQPVILQAALVYPFGTNGKYVDVENYVSLNLIAGYAAALKGLEVSGFGSALKDYGEGVQVAGFGNIVNNYFKGVQVSGFANIVGNGFSGVQITGFANIGGGDFEGVQVSGFTNIGGGTVSGLQITGFANINGGNVEGFQIGGFTNINGGSVSGFQVAGFANINENFDGFQISPFNIAGNVSGFQIGVVNISKSMRGLPIGIITYVKDGYQKIDVWGNESFYMNAAFKTGLKGFYNIIGVGFRPGDFSRYGLTWGIGSEIPLGKGAFVNMEATATQIGEDEIWTNKLNLLNQFKLNFGGMVAPKLGIYAGPTFNVLVSEYINAGGGIGSDIAPSWHFYDETNGNTNIKMWIGLNLGLRIL